MSARERGMSDRLLTARELAAYLGLKPATVFDKWQRGELPGFKFGRAVRFDLEDFWPPGGKMGRAREEKCHPPLPRADPGA